MKKLLSSDPVLKILKVQLIFPLQMLTSTHVPPAKYLDAICSLMQLVQDARFIAIYIDAQTLLECDVDQVIDAKYSLRWKLKNVISSRDSADREIKLAIDGRIDYGALK